MKTKYLLPILIAFFVLISAVVVVSLLPDNTVPSVDKIDNENTIDEIEKKPPVKESDDKLSTLTVSSVASSSNGGETQKPNINTVSFAAVGDNIIHSSVYSDAANNASGSDKDYDFLPMFENIAPIIKQADLAYINQESPFAGKENGGYSGYPMFNSPDTVGYDLMELGFNVINLANNHMLDRRDAGYKRTIEFWQAQEDVTYIGGFLNKEDYENIRVVEKNGISIAFLAYTYGTNGIPLNKGSEMVIPLCDESSNDEIDRQTKKARELADIVIVSIHWGNEHWFEPSWLQEKQMQIMVDNGVDVILGSHSHVLQPMLWKDRPDGGKTLVIYSLSNILSGMEYMRNMVGGIAGFDIVKIGDDAFIQSPYFIPTVCHFNSGVRKFKIHKLSDYTEEMLRNHGTQVRGTDVRRSMDYLYGIVEDTIPDEFLIEDFYREEKE